MDSTKDKIVASAMLEFKNYTYDQASINRIRERGNFSKGIVYHYFKNKDALYLYCVEDTFNKLADYLKTHEAPFEDMLTSLQHYYACRMEFFKLHDDLQMLFVNALFNPPFHLLEAIQIVKKNLNDYNADFFKSVLEHVELNGSFEVDEVIEYFSIMSYGIAQKLSLSDLTYEAKLVEQEKVMQKAVEAILFGIIKERESLC